MMELDRRYTVVLPKGTISEVGIAAIQSLISRQKPAESDEWKKFNPEIERVHLPNLPQDWEWVWVLTTGTNKGTFPKRVANHYFKNLDVKFPKSLLAEIGNLARQHSADEVSFNFEFVDQFDWEDGDFGDHNACFIREDSIPLAVIASNGGWAIRFYDADDNGVARAWVAHQKGYTVVFNGYGFKGNATQTIAKVLAMHLGKTYRKVALSTSTNSVTVNSGSGYAIGLAEILEKLPTYLNLHWHEEHAITCENCGDGISEDDVYYGPDDMPYCEGCHGDLFSYCEVCDHDYDRDRVSYIEADSKYVCEWCQEKHYSVCDTCCELFHNRNIVIRNNMPYCEDHIPALSPKRSPTPS
jgi:hypothetical protein